MSSQRVLGIVLLVAGCLLLAIGLNATDSVGESVREGLIGNYSDKTMWFIVGGSVMVVVGGAATLLGGGRTRST